MFYLFLIFSLLYTAGIFLYRHICRFPPTKSQKRLKNLINNRQCIKDLVFKLIVNPLISPVSKFIKIEKQKEIIMRNNLVRADINTSPQEYYARAIIIATLTLPISLFVYLLNLKILLPVTLALTIVIYLHYITILKDKLKEKKEAIEKGLPNFVRSIIYKIGGNTTEGGVTVDLINIFTDYYNVIEKTKENKIFQFDIAILIMEMKSIDIESALKNFEKRINLTSVTYFVQALIGIHRGENQGIRLDTLSKDMSKMANENLKRELDKRPGKVRLAIIPLVIIAVISLLYVIVSHLIISIGVIF